MAFAREALRQNPHGVIETIARECGVPTLAVIAMLPDRQRTFVPADNFEWVWDEISGWGEVHVVVHTQSIVLECAGQLPRGSYGRGYFNFHGLSPVSGHLKADACTQICLVDRPFHGRRSCSVQFYDRSGEAIFKIFVRRDHNRELVTEQLGLFEALVGRFASQEAGTGA